MYNVFCVCVCVIMIYSNYFTGFSYVLKVRESLSTPRRSSLLRHPILSGFPQSNFTIFFFFATNSKTFNISF